MYRFYMGFKEGLLFIHQGGVLLKKHPSLLRWVVAPFFCYFLLFLLGIYLGQHYLLGWLNKSFTEMLLPHMSSNWFDVLHTFVVGVLWIVFLFTLTLLTYLFASIIACPFNSLLAERTLMCLNLLPDTPFQFKNWIKNAVHLFFVSLYKIVFFFMCGLGVFVLSFTPGLNFLTSLFALLVIAFDCLDYSFEALSLSFTQRLRLFMQFGPRVLGMSCCLLVIFLIPGLFLFTLPLGIIGTAPFFSDLSLPRSN